MKRILFVDDEPMILAGLRALLRPERRRWEVEFAASAAVALQAFDAARFDVVVSDMRMPETDGATLLAQIRSRDGTTKCVLLSGYAEESVLEDARPHCDVILSKPCRGADLVKALDGLLAA